MIIIFQIFSLWPYLQFANCIYKQKANHTYSYTDKPEVYVEVNLSRRRVFGGANQAVFVITCNIDASPRQHYNLTIEGR